jgi:hypothetical protein
MGDSIQSDRQLCGAEIRTAYVSSGSRAGARGRGFDGQQYDAHRKFEAR